MRQGRREAPQGRSEGNEGQQAKLTRLPAVFRDLKPPEWSSRTRPFWSALRVAHFVAQNARNETGTDVPVRHTSLNPRALAVQTDVLDGFL